MEKTVCREKTSTRRGLRQGPDVEIITLEVRNHMTNTQRDLGWGKKGQHVGADEQCAVAWETGYGSGESHEIKTVNQWQNNGKQVYPCS